MADMPPVDIAPEHLAIVLDILRKHVPGHEVWAFGSRAKRTAKRYSDLDLAIISAEPLSLLTSARLADDFSESDLPWRVDVLDWATTSAAFRKIVERDKVVLQHAASPPEQRPQGRVETRQDAPDFDTSKGNAMPADPSWRDLNQSMWNAKTPLHLNSPAYDIPGFKAGRTTLEPHEITDLGDVAGKRLIHLQCHFGLDTLSWARLGARVTGLDFSEPATKAATELARDLGLQADFVTSDVYDAPAAVGHRAYDIVYTGVGALCWLPDMQRWGRVVHDLLRPGGQLYLFEFHPFKWMIEDSGPSEVTIRDSYFSPPDGYTAAGGVTYADTSIPAAATPTVQWNHSLGEVVTALVQAGLRIDSLRELDGDVLGQWDGMARGEDGLYRMPPGRPSLPLMYVLRAHRPV